MSLVEPTSSSAPIVVTRWPTEKPLLVLTAIAAAIMWLVLIMSAIGFVYIVMIGLFLWMMHLFLVGNLRGSAVRLGPQQFPELYNTIDTLSRRMMMRTPEAYLMQAGGALNAFATRFVGSNIIVLYSDLLKACGDDTAARDMIIAHELGHIKCNHVRWQWLLLPGAFIPFLGSALSRAREYTCDRYGLAGAGDRDGAAMGLTILASGGAHASRVNKSELARQREAVSRSGLMTLAEWFGTHPPLSKRIAQINPALVGHASLTGWGPALAGAFVFGIPVVIGLLVWQASTSDLMKTFRAAMDSSTVRPVAEAPEGPYLVPPDAAERAREDVTRIAAFVHAEQSRGSIPWNIADLKERVALRFRTDFPVDPYLGIDYGYEQRGEHFVVWSSGADQRSWTADDIRYDSRVGRIVGDTASKQ